MIRLTVRERPAFLDKCLGKSSFLDRKLKRKKKEKKKKKKEKKRKKKKMSSALTSHAFAL